MTETIATSARIEPFTPPAIAKRDPKPVFWIKTPTPHDRDTLSPTLYRLGLREVTQEITRATLINELYEIFHEEQAEEKAVLLDTFWQVSALDEQAFATWHEAEQQRLLDVEYGAPDTGPIPMPTAITSPRQKAQARLLVDEVTNQSERMLKLLERKMNFGREQGIMLVRLGLHEVDDLEGIGDLMRSADGLVSPQQVDLIRERLPDSAWLQLIERIDQGYTLGGEEVGNFGSPLAKHSDQTGSDAPSGASESSDGKWTGSNTAPAPIVESATITEPSSSTSSEPAN